MMMPTTVMMTTMMIASDYPLPLSLPLPNLDWLEPTAMMLVTREYDDDDGDEDGAIMIMMRMMRMMRMMMMAAP